MKMKKSLNKSEYFVPIYLSIYLSLTLILIANLLGGSMGYAAQETKTLLSDIELVNSRDSSTRVYERTYQIQILDKDGNPTGESYIQKRHLTEKADGLCYDNALSSSEAGSPEWLLTSTNFVSKEGGGWKVETGPLKVSIAQKANANPLVSFNVPYRSGVSENDNSLSKVSNISLNIKAGKLAYVDNEDNVRIISSASSIDGTAEGNKITYSYAFPCGDLELIYERGGFHQNVVIRDASAIPPPTDFGLYPETTKLCIVTEIENITSAEAEHKVSLTTINANETEKIQITSSSFNAKVEGSNAKLRFGDKSEKDILVFDFSKAFLKDGGNEVLMDKIIMTSADSSSKFTHIEGVSYSDYLKLQSKGEVVLDYYTRTGGAWRSEAWQAGETYWISDYYTIPSGLNLSIEGGAVIKVAPYRSIIIEDSAGLKIKGSPFNYVLFGTRNDDIGEDTYEANAGPPREYISIVSATSSTEIEISFAKFSESFEEAISGYLISSGFSLKVENCIFINTKGVTLISASSSSINSTIECFNCLFYGDKTDIISLYLFGSSNTMDSKIINCTFAKNTLANNTQAIYLHTVNNNSISFKSINNLFTNYQYGADCFAGSGINSSSYINCSITNIYGGVIHGPNLNITETNTNVSTFSYQTSPNGNYYPDYYFYPEGGPWQYTAFCRDLGTCNGLSSDQIDRLKATTIYKPFNLNNTEGIKGIVDNVSFNDEINDDPQSTIKPDIGFHYDIVHGVVDDDILITESLSIGEGKVISYVPGTELQIQNADFDVAGTPDERCIFTLTDATSDKLKDPRINTSVTYAVRIDSGANHFDIDFANFEFFSYGIYSYNDAVQNVKNSIFRENVYGILISSYGKSFNLQNCLFLKNSICGFYDKSIFTPLINIQGCTFDGNTLGIKFVYNYLGTTTWKTVLEDNVFVNNDKSLDKDPSYVVIHDLTRNNLFWNNINDSVTSNILNGTLHIDSSTNLIEYDPSEPDNRIYNPLQVHRTRSSVSEDIVKNWNEPDSVFDGHYLAQLLGDASRTPFIVESGRALLEEGGITFDGITFNDELGITVKVDEGNSIPSSWDVLGNIWGYRGSWYYSFGQAASYRGPLVIEIISTSGEIFISDGYVVLHFDDGTNLQICIPDLTIPDVYAIAFFVTEDGSTYYTELTRDAIPAIQYDMDAYYATRWEPQNLAAGAYDHRVARLGSSLAKSPAVDAGSLDFLSGATTKSQHTSYPLASSYQDHEAPSSIRQNDSSSVLTDSLTHKIDLGYHYGAAAQGDYFTTLRHPRDGIGDIEYNEETFSPNDNLSKYMALASGSFDNDRDRTVICYLTEYKEGELPNEDPYMRTLIAWHRFRDSSTGVVVDLAPIQIPGDQSGKYWSSKVTRVAMTTSENSQGSEEETIYLAINMDLLIPYASYQYYGSRILVYRHDPTSSWIKIAEHISDDPNYFIRDVAVAADGDGLTVHWIKNYYDQNQQYDAYISAYKISDAATRTTTYSFPDNPIHFFTGGLTDNPLMSSDWDPDIQKPRISWNELDSSRFIVRAGQVVIQFGQPYSITESHIISDNDSENACYPVISVNRFPNPTMVNHSNSKEAYAIFYNELYEDCVRYISCDSSSGVDTWDQTPTGDPDPTIIPNSDNHQASITYRALGLPRYAYISIDEKLLTDTETICSGGYMGFPVMNTNKDNKTDIFLTYSDEELHKIMIMQINP